MGDLGQRFADAVGRQDAEALRAVLRPDVEFKAMTPSRFWEADDADTVVDDIILGAWFEPSNVIREVVSVETATVGTRGRVGYRFMVDKPEGRHVVEQQAYYQADGDRIGWLRVMCTGWQPVA